ncbi:FliI/YscN family ATPase [Hyphomonas sp.]|uniref:FliI/YscN family ATPase n=1 Tax=Hyphomonas sp. TaxID=87 RepID=UPI0025C0FA85|nr:FliI/YscN family ATPase [Hyphomonas sp.]
MTPVSLIDRLKGHELVERAGYVRRVTAGHIEATGPSCTVGDLCEVDCGPPGNSGPARKIFAEVAAVEVDRVVLVPLDTVEAVHPDARVLVRPQGAFGLTGPAFAGRAVDALARPIDGGGVIAGALPAPLMGEVLAPMQRAEPSAILATGVRVIDALMPIGRGQRIGVFAASGVGKTSFIRQIAAQSDCDRIILCLVGERGREVESLWREISARSDAYRFSCVAATSDVSAALRARAVYQALCLAEMSRNDGEHVLLIIDSVTRYAMALREIGLAAGAPPTLRAYTPNVFAALPRIVERCGGRRAGGSVTAIMTILAETDEVEDPIAEVMKSLLDGHIILSRTLAEQGHFPAVDAVRSISRQADSLMSAEHARSARSVLNSLAVFEESRVMIESGVYRAGSKPVLDEAIAARASILAFLKQPRDEASPLEASLWQLGQLALKGRRP